MIALRSLAVAVLAVALLGGCQQQNRKPQLVLSKKGAVELRAMQARAFDTTDRNRTLRTVIATLQDLGYTLDKVEPAAGTVSATKMASNDAQTSVPLRMSVAVTPRGQSQMVVRTNALVALPGSENQVDDPKFYQQLFFEPLSKAMFLSALQVEDAPDMPSDPSPSARSEK